MQKESKSFKEYCAAVHPSRVNFMLSPGINFFMGQRDPKKLHAFLLVWTAFSIKMTEKVESWIKRAGEQCEAIDLKEVGTKLKHHAVQEKDHDLMLVEDLKILIQKWNDIYNDNITENEIFKLRMPSNTDEYVLLHENTIQGPFPYSQVAIEYEIERVSVVYGPRMIDNVIYTLGEEFEAGIGFLADHVLLDQGHTKFNMDLLERCFISQANKVALAETGSAALRIYSGFLNECVELSSEISRREKWTSALTT